MSPGGGLPALEYVGEPLRVGGRLDTLTRRYVGPCEKWRVWLVGERQREIIEAYIAYVERGEGKRHQLLYSAEGAGKTVLMAMLGWIAIFLATSMGIPGALGATAPTHARLGTLVQAMRDLGPVTSGHESAPGAWGHFYVDAGDIATPSGHVIQTRSTKKQSGATGSPIQGWNWALGALMDEAQDSVEQGSYEDVAARLRSGARPPIVATATAKDSPAWRTWRDSLSDNWEIRRLRYTDTPFVHDEHWLMMQAECSPREWQRRGLAMDVAPERATYPDFRRERHLRPMPDLNGRDASAYVFGGFDSYVRPGSAFRLLACHDPGRAQNTTVFLRPYLVPQGYLEWWVVGEFITERTTQRQHAAALKKHVQDEYELNLEPDRWDMDAGSERVLVLNDPHSKGEKHPDQDEYQSFRALGLDIFPASSDGPIKRRTRLETVNRMLLTESGRSRLFFAVGADGAPMAPKTVESFELQELDAAYEAEKARKGTAADITHPAVAVGYGLWLFEREAMTEYTLAAAVRGMARR